MVNSSEKSRTLENLSHARACFFFASIGSAVAMGVMHMSEATSAVVEGASYTGYDCVDQPVEVTDSSEVQEEASFVKKELARAGVVWSIEGKPVYRCSLNKSYLGGFAVNMAGEEKVFLNSKISPRTIRHELAHLGQAINTPYWLRESAADEVAVVAEAALADEDEATASKGFSYPIYEGWYRFLLDNLEGGENRLIQEAYDEGWGLTEEVLTEELTRSTQLDDTTIAKIARLLSFQRAITRLQFIEETEKIIEGASGETIARYIDGQELEDIKKILSRRKPGKDVDPLYVQSIKTMSTFVEKVVKISLRLGVLGILILTLVMRRLKKALYREALG
jgi:hypothetical protein